MPARGPIEAALRNLPARARAELKAREIVKELRRRKPGGGAQIAAAGRDVDVMQIEVEGRMVEVEVEGLRADGDVLIMTLTIAGGRIAFDNPLIIRNPPVLVPDGTMSEAVDEDGNRYMTANYREDPVEALRLVIEQTVRGGRR